jgi:molybdate transport system substrate-binding protein
VRRAWAIWLALGLAACGGPADSGDALSVFAASSLTDAFTDLARSFEEANPGTGVRLSFAGSQTLSLQIQGGAGADVFASADAEHIAELDSLGLVEPPRVFAHNELVVIVPSDNPAGIEQFGDLDRARRIVIGAPEVPLGRYTRQMLAPFAENGVLPDGTVVSFGRSVLARVVSEEPNARQVRAKVELGEADAAVVYRTDALGSDRVRTIAIPGWANVRTQYQIAVVRGTVHHEAAEAWILFLLSAEGLDVLRAHGFVVD